MNAFTTESLVKIATGVTISRASIILSTPKGDVTIPDSIVTSAPNMGAEDTLSKLFAAQHKGSEVDSEGRATFLSDEDRAAILAFAKNQNLNFEERRRKAEYRAMTKMASSAPVAPQSPSLKMTI